MREIGDPDIHGLFFHVLGCIRYLYTTLLNFALIISLQCDFHIILYTWLSHLSYACTLKIKGRDCS